MKLLLGFSVLVIIVFLDQWTKSTAQQHGLVTLNPGISFGFLQGTLPQWPQLLGILGMLIFLVVVTGVALSNLKGMTQPWKKYLLLGGLWGGAVSNLLDRQLFGGVRDWWQLPLISLKNNLADWAILVSLMLLGWEMLKLGKIPSTEHDDRSVKPKH